MKTFCNKNILLSIDGGKQKKTGSAAAQPELSENESENVMISLKCRRKGTSPETVEFIKNIVVGGLQLLFYPVLK